MLYFLHCSLKLLLLVTVKIHNMSLHQFSNLKRNAYLVEDHQIFFAHFAEPCCIQSSPLGQVKRPHFEHHFGFCHIHLLQLYSPHAYLQQLQKNITNIPIQQIQSCYVNTEATKIQKNHRGLYLPIYCNFVKYEASILHPITITYVLAFRSLLSSWDTLELYPATT